MSLKILNDLSHELLLTTRQKTKLKHEFNNNMPTDLKFSNAQISKIMQSGGFSGSLLSKLVGSLMKVAVSLAKHIVASLGIIAAVPAIDTGIQRKIHGSGHPSSTSLIILNKEISDIMKVVQVLEDFNSFLKRVTKTTKNKTKKQKGGILSMLLGTLGASFLGNLLSRKGTVRGGSGNKKRKGTVRAGNGNI